MENPKSLLQAGDDLAASVQKTTNRVELKQLHQKIASIEYLNPPSVPLFTIAIVVLDNGFVVTGESACVDPGNYNEAVGRQIALDNAVRKIWPLEGYVMREKLHQTGE